VGDVVYFTPQKLTREPEQPTRIQATMSGGRVNGHEWRTLSFKNTNGSNLELTLRLSGRHDCWRVINSMAPTSALPWQSTTRCYEISTIRSRFTSRARRILLSRVRSTS
jgi:hypothetical protein